MQYPSFADNMIQDRLSLAQYPNTYEVYTQNIK